MKLLYPEEQKYRKILQVDELPCHDWKLQPIVKGEGRNKGSIMVCGKHKKIEESKIVRFAYPGDLVPGLSDLNYRERSILSPVKLYSQITRKSTFRHGRIGHYVMTGTISTMHHNYEFAQMAYGGTLSLFFRRGQPEAINADKVKAMYGALQNVNPLLARYKLPKLTYALVNYHITENKQHIGSATNWTNNALFAMEDINPEATTERFRDLIIGEDNEGKSIKYSHPSLLALTFPHLFTTSSGHYSLMSSKKPAPEYSTPLEQLAYEIPETKGGVALATLRGESLSSFAKSRLLMRDRRFAKDPSFLFFMLDIVEKMNIATANRFVVSTKGRTEKLKQSDIVNNTTKKLNKNLVSTVPPQIRSSYAYKRKNFLDLQCIFENLGSPQLFLTFTCNDSSLDFKDLVPDTAHSWDDPATFVAHWKRKWQEFFKKYVLGHFADQIGGVKEHSWVMEIQDRGSPHIHLVLWTEKTVDQLIDMGVVHTGFPPGVSQNDPLMHHLVNTHQLHTCNENYCKRGQPDRPCRFGFPKPQSPVTYMDENHQVIYRRDVTDCMVNNYNPYLLAVFRANMDIQYNDGPQAVRYLAKYMAKDDYSTTVTFKNVGKSNQGHYQKSAYVKESEHLKTRIVGAVEAVYDLLGWHKHSNSRNVLFLKTALIGHSSLRIRDDIKQLPQDSEDIYAKTQIEIYENRDGAKNLTLPEFFCFYIRKSQAPEDTEIRHTQEMINRRFYSASELPKFVYSEKLSFILRTRDRVAFWRTYNESEMNGETFYYQQVVTKKAIFGTTFQNAKGAYHTWKDYYEHLISIPVEEGGIEPSPGRTNVQTIDDIIDLDRGETVTKQELKIMLNNANNDQKSIYNQIKNEMEVNSAVFVSGAAGTGKSYVLRMLERYYRLKGYKVCTFALLKLTLSARTPSNIAMCRYLS
ncbi:hypothetical protein [Parasitella parasitica]|uniref:Helitron helicase-like domain-containing protein n=1 Tax=Parasitella parasitica TaxID=35722 RepID=A0A0B7N3F7_9FUNG|nr:hypothetical protein [Parasitella parasitica]